MKSLSEAAVSDSVSVCGLLAKDYAKERMLALGITRGAKIGSAQGTEEQPVCFCNPGSNDCPAEGRSGKDFGHLRGKNGFNGSIH